MTEYDYSPGAFERQKAKFASIDNWREGTGQHPLTANALSALPNSEDPGLTPDDSISHAGVPNQQYYYPQAQMAVPQAQMYQPQAYIQPQLYYSQPSYPGYYSPPQVVSPTYPYEYRSSSSRKSSSKYGHHHSSGSRSHHASPSSSSVPLHVPNANLGVLYVPTLSFQSDSSAMGRSYSTPPNTQQSYFTPYPGGYPQQQQLMQPASMTYPASAPAMAPYPYMSADGTLSPYTQSGYALPQSHSRPSRSSTSHSSTSHSSSHAHSHSHGTAVTSPAYGQANPNEPLIIPYGNGGKVIIPPAGVSYMAPHYVEQHTKDHSSFLGSLKNLTLKGSKNRKLKRRSSRSSY